MLFGKIIFFFYVNPNIQGIDKVVNAPLYDLNLVTFLKKILEILN